MIPQLKAEFKKLLTVRSTYVLTTIILLLTGLFTYTGTSKVYEEPAGPVTSQSSEASQPEPTKTSRSQSAPQEMKEPKLTNNLPKETILSKLQDSIYPTSLVIAVVVVLLMAHEFRYNTIAYTLTSSNNRSRVLAAKILVATTYASVITLVVILISLAATYLAISVKGLNLPSQDIDWLYIISRLLAYSIGFSLFAMALMTLLRNITAGIAAIFLAFTLNNIAASILMTHNIEPTKFLPFSALTRISGIVEGSFSQSGLSPTSVTGAMIVFGLYLVGLWAISWYLFLRRDATQ